MKKIELQDFKLKQLSIVLVTMLAGCLGDSGGTVGTTTSIPVAGANSPLIGVMVQVDCANGASGTGPVGTNAAPGVGTVTVNGTCTPPVKITAIGAGMMRPVGAPADGSGDVTYDPAVNLPVTAISSTIPTPTSPITVDPVTTLVANNALNALGMASGTTLAAQLSNAALIGNAGKLATAQATVAGALGIPVGSINNQYNDPDIAAASTRLTEIAALAASGVTTIPSDVANGKQTMGQYVAIQLATAAGIDGASLTTASGVASALKTATTPQGGTAAIDVTANPAVAANGAIDNDAGRVSNIIKNATTVTGTNPASAADMLVTVITASTAPAGGLTGTEAAAQDQVKTDIPAHLTKEKEDEIRNTTVALAAGIIAANAGRACGTSAAASTCLDTTARDNLNLVAIAAAEKLKKDILAKLAGGGATAPDLLAQVKAVGDAIKTVVANDSGTGVFSTPPAVGIGSSGLAAALVGKLESDTRNVTVATPPTVPTATLAMDATTVATAINNSFTTPPAPGLALDAAIAAIA